MFKMVVMVEEKDRKGTFQLFSRFLRLERKEVGHAPRREGNSIRDWRIG